MIKVSQATEFRSLIIGVLLASATACLLFITGKTGTLSGIEQALVIIAGMTAVSALSAFEQFTTSRTASFVTDFSFNEAIFSKSIEAFAEDSTITVEAEEVLRPTPLPWDLSLSQLVGVDNSLALAKLRIDIERELRRIAYGNQIDVGTRPLGVSGLAKELIAKEVLPAAWLETLKEIISVCNRAIHGAEVPDDMAASVVRVGGQLLERLRLVSITGSNHVAIQAP